MESLALLVGGMYLGEITFGLITLVFAILYRVKNKFAITTTVFVVVLALVTAVSMQIPAFGIPALLALIPSALLRFLPRKPKK